MSAHARAVSKPTFEHAATILHVTGAIGMTGALRAAIGMRNLISPFARSIITVSDQWDARRFAMPPECVPIPIELPVKKLSALLRYPWRLVRAAVFIRELVSKEDVDVIVVNDFFYMEPVILRLLGYRGRIVTWVRIDPRRYGAIGRMWLAATHWASSSIVAVSDFILSTLPKTMKAVRIYDPAPTPAAIVPPSGQTFLFVGNYVEGKGQDEAIAAFHRIAERYPEARLKFIGGDLGQDANRTYRARMAELASRGPGAPQIVIGGFVDNVAGELARSLAALNFSHSESFSLTCLEASANGRAVIATDCGGPPEIIDDGTTGFIVPVGDVEAMAARMEDLLSRPGLAVQMGEAGARLAAERFGQDAFVNAIRAVLLAPLTKRRGA